jgi:hypothetical protein
MLGTLNNYVAFSLKPRGSINCFINKEYSGVQSNVFITTREDRPCFLRVDPPLGAVRGNPLSQKTRIFRASSKKMRTVT